MTNDINGLQQNNWKFELKRLPNTVFFINSINLPGVTMNALDYDNQLIKIPVPGDKLTFNTLNIEFTVDENLNNYFEIFDWMKGLGFADNFEQYKTLKASEDGIYSDASLVITTNSNTPNVTINFKDMFPTDLSDLTFDILNEELLKCSVTFTYQSWDYQRVT